MKIPLVVINTVDGEEPTCEVVTPPPGAWGSGIQNATKVPASMKIIVNGSTLYDSGEYVKKESGLTIKIRGNTSGKKAKKPYKLKLQKKADLLLRNDKKFEDKDWVLLRTGRSLINPIGFWVSELIGQEWTPSHQFVNVYMNGTYRGLYVLCEHISVNRKCRINVDEEDGYVVEADPYWWNEDLCFSSSLMTPELKFTYKYPDTEDLTDEWHQAISEDVLAHETKISDDTYDEAYDCESFAKWLLAWDLLCNDDTAGGNMYLVKKDTNSKICMGPIWDFDYALHWSDDWVGRHYKYFYFHLMFDSTNDRFRKTFYSLWQDHGWEVVKGVIDKINTFA
ncbi:MAG: CotH kinase family protein, partial [Muribaculaceae bacterium]|nr:CotH kinase family protein [Muribaculaceae bacterium]